ncbi:MAG TPA: hypothetical protein VMM18_18370 [Gemmatimonadaceae bacterium]|nr:hypothetical protein [Gemmatimonadaceae bacterium]
MNETRERFLREIADRVPAGRLSELHLFPPLRQGGVESGVAVVATELEVPVVEPGEVSPLPTEKPRRHTVYTARYRHTLKGADRGKWEFDLVAEADAPLATVDAVVRGVQKRTGDLGDPERLDPEQLRAALDETPWRATTR